MLPFPDHRILLAIEAQEELRQEIKSLIKIYRRFQALLDEKSLSTQQYDVLCDLLALMETRRKVLEGNWYLPDHMQRGKGI